VYGERVWFECVSEARVESALWSAGRSMMRASASVAALTLIFDIEARRVRSREPGRRASVEGGVGSECVCVRELDSCV